jgi:hypothetical protein
LCGGRYFGSAFSKSSQVSSEQRDSRPELLSASLLCSPSASRFFDSPIVGGCTRTGLAERTCRELAEGGMQPWVSQVRVHFFASVSDNCASPNIFGAVPILDRVSNF